MAEEIDKHRIAYGSMFEVLLPIDVRQDILDNTSVADPKLFDVARELLRKMLAQHVVSFEQAVKCVALLSDFSLTLLTSAFGLGIHASNC